MKEITLRISEKKLHFFMELMDQLGFEVVKEETTVPEWQQEFVKQSKQEIEDGIAELSDWESIRGDLFKKYNVK